MKHDPRANGPARESGARRRITRRGFMAGAGGIAGAALLAGARPLFAAADGPARVTVRRPGTLTVLALTDTHFYQKPYKDAWTVREIKAMADQHRPDLGLVCGDMWYNNPKGRGLEFCRGACDYMAGLGIPWAFVRGNHDIADEFAAAEQALMAAPFSLYRAGADGNYTIEVMDPGGTDPWWELIIVNDAGPEMGFREPQIEWFNAEAARIKAEYSPAPPAFVFAHVPLPQYQDMVDSGAAKGVKGEKVSHEGGSREALSAIRDSGLVKAMFCGHDHLNNYYGDMDGAHLQYLRASGHGGYGGARVRKGGTVITADAGRRDFSTASVFPSGRAFAWEPRVPAGKAMKAAG
ncbi:MAG TPA: metallophosphoesterase [bacterium]|nr:metallophosphoesterase [bacterium]